MAGEIITVSAPAKINLYLKITGRRADGYHLLATLMQKIGLVDTLVLQRVHTGIRLNCPGCDLPVDEENLVYRAAQLFFAEVLGQPGADQAGVEITLNKSIPIAAGLGGGSSDAAATLCGLNRLFGTNCSTAELLAMAVSLGADVPQFVMDWPVVWATGIGDKLHRAVPLGEFKILLVNPGISVATKWVYEKFALTADQNINNLINSQNNSVAGEKGSAFTVRSIRPDELENDLESVTAVHYPVINKLKKRLLEGGASSALMSGSGPSVYGIFPKNCDRQAAICYEELRREFGSTFLVEPLH